MRHRSRICDLLSWTLAFCLPSLYCFSAQAGTAAEQRTNQLDPRVRAVPADLQARVFAADERAFGTLVDTLLKGVEDPFHRVRILHDWVADNIVYDVEGYLNPSRRGAQDWAATLRSRKSVCEGYSSLLKKMCDVAGIPCHHITGYGRGYSFRHGGAEDVSRNNHAWNAVHIEGRWYFVDSTWDAGYLHGREFRKSFTHAYLFMEPVHFIYTHFPKDPKWQILKTPLTGPQFANLPNIKGRFFAYGLRFQTRLSKVSRATSSIRLVLTAPDDVLIMAQLEDLQGTPRSQRTLIRRESAHTDVLVTFPEAGRWRVHLHCKRREEKGSYWRAATLEFQASKGTSSVFPKTYSNYLDLGASLRSPLYVPFGTTEEQEFEVKVAGIEEAFLVIGGKRWEKFTPKSTEADTYTIRQAIPAGQPVMITIKPQGSTKKSLPTLVDFSAPK